MPSRSTTGRWPAGSRVIKALSLLVITLLASSLVVGSRMISDARKPATAPTVVVGSEPQNESVVVEPPPVRAEATPPATPTVPRKAVEAANSGWDSITTIYYNPQEDTGPEPYLAAGAADLEGQLELVRPNSFSITTTSPSTPAVRLLVLPPLRQYANWSDDSFALASGADGITITGKTSLAVRHGVYRLLDTLGFRWFFPHPAWSVVPGTLAPVTFTPEVQTPAYQERKISTPAGFLVATEKGRDLHRLWRARNLLDSGVSYPAHHSYEAFAPLKEMAAEHPDAVCTDASGTPQNVRPSAAVVLERAKNWANGYFDKPTALKQGWMAVPISPTDGGQRCPEWTKPDGKVDYQKATDAVFGLASGVARHLQTARPGKYASILSYNVYSSLPSIPLEPNLFVLVTGDLGVVGTKLTVAERLDGFRARGVKTGVYEYLNVWQYTHDRPYGAGKMQEKLDSLVVGASSGATTYVAEGGDNWGAKGRTYWLASRLFWSPNTGFDRPLEDFYGKAFGAAKAPMKRYFARLDAQGPSFALRPAFVDLDEALRLAAGAGETDVEERIRHLVLYTYYDWRWGRGISDDYAFGVEEMKALYNYVWRVTNLHIISVKPEKGAIAKKLGDRFGLSNGQLAALEDTAPPTESEVRHLLDDALRSASSA